MKYIRKIVSFIIAAVIIASVAIGVGMIFAVRNVNVTLQSYLYETDSKEAEEEISEYKSLILGDLRGKIIAFVNVEDIENAIKGSKYSLVSFEKKYPCTLNVEICERKEKYVVREDGTFLIYDDSGAYLRMAYEEAESYNPLDNAPNVEIIGTQSDEEIALVAQMGSLFAANFAPLRSTVESIVLEKSQSQFAKSRIIYNLRCGVCVEIQDYEELASEKIIKSFSVYTSLSGEEKLSGKIYAFTSNDGVAATYDKNA